jgi:type I restriction enzyme, S subunit
MDKARSLGGRTNFSRRRLADVVDRLTNGFVGPTRDIYVEQGLPYLLARHVRDGQLKFDRQTFISSAFNDRNKKSMLKAGDVLLVQSGHIGHSAVVSADHEGHNCHALIVISPKQGLLCGEFLSHFFGSPEMRQLFGAMRSGSTVPHLTCAAVREVLVPLPYITEQQRIVAILDEAFEGIAAARVNAEKNLQNAKDLYECQLESLFASGDLKWPEHPLEKMANIINGYAFKSTDFQADPGIRSIKITNVGVREFVDDESNYLPAAFAQWNSGVTVSKGSIVLALTRTIIAGGLKVAVVPHDFDGALLNQRVAAIQPHAAELEAPFLYAYLSSRRVMNYVKARVNTLMQPNLSIADLRSLPLPLPALSMQRELVASLDRFGEDSQRLESVCLRRLAALDELKKSLLRQAFAGMLTARCAEEQVAEAV